jgi:hypothetical protein
MEAVAGQDSMSGGRWCGSFFVDKRMPGFIETKHSSQHFTLHQASTPETG